jgi:hypothetical protein
MMFINNIVSNFNFTFRGTGCAEYLGALKCFPELPLNPVSDDLNFQTEKSKEPDSQHTSDYTIQNRFKKSKIVTFIEISKRRPGNKFYAA